ncbi:MAG: sigma-70 family RNA polymerase sigma factor, partial [Bacteroidota bacterium]
MDKLTTVIKGCVAKEQKCQKLLYEHFYGFALKIVFRYIYRYEKAVDVTNDGFVKLFRSFEKFVPCSDADNEKMLMGYLKRIMINTAIDELRKGKMVPEIGGMPEHIWDATVKEHDADQMLLYKDLIIMIKELQPQYRAVFNMYVI